MMKALKSKNFEIVLQVVSFFKIHAVSAESMFSESIRNMEVEDLYINITHTKFDTQLIQDILVFFLSQLKNRNLAKNQNQTSNFILGGFPDTKKLTQKYYTQMAIAEYISLFEEQNYHKQLISCSNFCKLKQQTKFDLLSKLTTKVYQIMLKRGIIGCKNEKKSNEQTSTNEGQNKKKVQEIIILGEDNKNVYFFFPFMPNFILSNYMGSWSTLGQGQIIQKLNKILDEPMSTNNLFLCESLSSALSKLIIKKQQKNEIMINRAKIEQNSKDIVQKCRMELLQIDKRYCNYLNKFNDRVWGKLKDRQNYVKNVQNARNLDQLISSFRQFYNISHDKILVRAKREEEQQANEESSYWTQKRPNCNIHTVPNKKNDKSGATPTSQQISLMLFEQENPQKYALFELNIAVMEKSMDSLELKQKNYYKKLQQKQKYQEEAKQRLLEQQKQQEKQTEKLGKRSKIIGGRSMRDLRESSYTSLSSLENSKNAVTKVQPRKKKTKAKLFGARIIDSDDSSDSDSNQKIRKEQQHELSKYHYKACLRGK